MTTPFIPIQSAVTLAPQQGALTDISAFYGVTNSGIIAYDQDVVGGCLFNVMSTLVGDECFEPTYGCDLPKRVFEPITAKITQTCLMDVYLAAKNFVAPNLVDLSQTSVYASADNRVVGVAVAYFYAGAGWLQPISLGGINNQ